MPDTIDNDGELIRSKAGMKEHPLLKHELAREPSYAARCNGSA
jgi:hypothetical protein